MQRARRLWGFLVMGAVMTACAWAQTPHVYAVQGAVAFTHDPSIAKDGNTYYVFATGRAPGGQFPIRCSEDLVQWRMWTGI